MSHLKSVSIPRHIKAIYIYGSIVRGRLRPDSDIDAAILTSYRIDDLEKLELMSRIEGIFSSFLRKIGFQHEVSILDLRNKYVSLELQHRVITDGIVLYTKNIHERLEFENAVKGEYFDFKPYLRFLREKKYGLIY